MQIKIDLIFKFYFHFQIIIFKNESVKLYVDEFAYIPEFYNNFNDLVKNYQDIIYDGYFTSTMSADINGAQVISKLIKLNENKYYVFNVVYNLILQKKQ